MASKRSKNTKNSKKRKQALDVPSGQRRKQALDVTEGQSGSQQNIFGQMLSVESSEIPKDPHTDREKSPSGPFVLVTPFEVDRGRSLVKSVSFTPTNREKSSTNRESSLVRSVHTETSASAANRSRPPTPIISSLTSSVTPINLEGTSRTPTPINLERTSRAPTPINLERTSRAPTPINLERTSRAPTPILSPMQIDLDKDIDHYTDDDDDDNEDHNDIRDKRDNREPLPKPHIVEGERYLTMKEFNYSMNLLNGKINAIYKICRYIGDQQQKSIQDMQNIAKSDLSDDFWNRVYKNVAKELIPTTLYPSDIEYRNALETYLSKHADHYIKNIGQNAWISLFSDKLLAEIKTKCRSRRNDFAASIRNAMFSVFGEQRLERIDNNSPSMKIAEWKQNQKTRDAFYDLFRNHEILTKIGYSVFKQYRNKELPLTHCAYILSICDILLNPNSYTIKCNDKSVTKRVEFFLQAFRNKTQITPRIMEELAEREAKEISQRSDQYESTVTEEHSESVDNDDFINNLDSQFLHD